MRRYIPLRYYEGGLTIMNFIIYGVGDLISCIVFPKYITYSDAIHDNDIAGLVKYAGEARFLYARANNRDISNVKAKKPNSPIALTDCDHVENNMVHVLLLQHWNVLRR